MINFLTTPIFFLTPYIFLWSIFNGLLTIALLQLLKIKISRLTKIATAVTTAIASILWNWSIEFNQSTIHLNVDHPYLRISWADGLNGVCVFALTALILGILNPRSQADTVVKIAGVAALLTAFTDLFFF
jgi:arginine exporter protein ArgO